ncbi:MAG: recombination-associated protein RdgC [Desulfobacterales bacterium]|nr:recombination-associated protein RdgC [Desulfobacterales bacterium]
MGILSSSVSITRYRVDGIFEKNVMEAVTNGLKKNAIRDIDSSITEKTAGWTAFENPYIPDFNKSSFSIDTYFVFSLRIDKKNIPVKVVKKFYTAEVVKKLKDNEKNNLSRNEKKMIKERVVSRLSLKIPATPNIYDIIWDYENKKIIFFSNLKAANEELESLFFKSFQLKLIRLFPYTMADLEFNLSEKQKDILKNISTSGATG